MDATRSDAFLSGQGIPVPLPEVESELAKLWGPAAEREGGPTPDQPNVTRVVIANLVVVDFGDDGTALGPLIETIGRRYPCRAIELRRATSTGRRVAAEVSALCHLPAPGRPQVCTERIVLTAGADSTDMLPGAVRPLLETDLPSILWWSGDPASDRPLFDDLADESTRVLIDFGDAASAEALVRGLDLTVNAYIRDVAWFGIIPWREAVAACFDGPDAAGALRRLASIEVTATSAGAERRPRVAAWLAGWIAGRLGRPFDAVTSTDEDVLRARFGSGSTLLETSIRTVIDERSKLDHVTSVVLATSTGERLTITRCREEPETVLTTVELPDRPSLHRHVHMPEWDAARRAAAALESPRDDPPYRAALPNMCALMKG